MATLMMRSPLLLLLTILLFAGCEETTGPGDTSAGTVAAAIDGSPYASTRANATFAGGVLNIMSVQERYGEEYYRIDLNINRVNVPGTYQLGALSGNSGHCRLEGSGVDYYTPLLALNEASGKVVVTQIDSNSVAGTFEFIAFVNAGAPPDKSVRVSQGSFDVKITR
jgi:Family of unknown function (DUF6252)